MIRKAKVARIPSLAEVSDPKDPRWNRVEPLCIDQFRPEGTNHHPVTSLKLLHDGQSLRGLFQVDDQYVRCLGTQYGDPVYKDSCVEFFFQPKPDRGYFSFEFNCGGAFLCNYITDPTRVPGGFKESVRLSPALVQSVHVRSSMPKIVEPEIAEPVSWWLLFIIPVQITEPFLGSIGHVSGQVWRGNAYKCADGTSHPHWAAWSPVDERNFHLPRCFGELTFE